MGPLELLRQSFSLATILVSLSTIGQVVSSKSPLVKLKKHSGGYSKPVAIVDANDGKEYLYVVERLGKIKRVNRKSGEVSDTIFLDVSSNVEAGGGEQGLLGLAFHPDYVSNGYFFVNYTQKNGGQLRTIVSRFSRKSDDDSDGEYFEADESSELVLLRFDQPYGNHNAGDLHFGPNDGYLYVTSGDGGSGGDPENNGQDLDTMLGKLLRIDVDQTPSNGKNYAIPSDNPFASGGGGGLPEIWSYGLRNPWRISFDRKTGDLFIADVGQNKWEEINFQPSSSTGGENYGWRPMEGTHCFNPSSGCDPSGSNFVMPVLEYGHDNGHCSVTGGYVYRGKKHKKLKGSYFYGDYCSGDMWAASKKKNGSWTPGDSNESGLKISSFGEDAKGELYVVDYGGTIYGIEHCSDKRKYMYQDANSKNRSCKWISKKKGRTKKYCKINEVRENCRQTCGNIDACSDAHK